MNQTTGRINAFFLDDSCIVWDCALCSLDGVKTPIRTPSQLKKEQNFPCLCSVTDGGVGSAVDGVCIAWARTMSRNRQIYIGDSCLEFEVFRSLCCKRNVTSSLATWSAYRIYTHVSLVRSKNLSQQCSPHPFEILYEKYGQNRSGF
jgi:hypothetical protein